MHARNEKSCTAVPECQNPESLVQGDATAVLAAIAVANRTRLPEAPLADANGGVVPRKGMAELLGAHRLRLRLAVTVFAWFTVSLVRAPASVATTLNSLA